MKHVIIERVKISERQVSETVIHNDYKRSIHYQRSEYMPIAQDETALKMIISSMNLCSATVSLFDEKNKWWKDDFRKRNAWITEGLTNTMIPKELKKHLEKLKKVDVKKDNEFTSEIATNLKPLYLYLLDVHKVQPKTCRELLLELLQGWFPDQKVFTAIEDETMKKALNRAKEGKF